MAVRLSPEEPPCTCSDYRQFDSLNPATREYGLLLPRAACQWQRPSTRSMGSVGFCPLSVMKNYLWVRPGLGYRIVNLYADFGRPPGRRLKIVASPLCSQAPFLLHCRPENSTFEVQYLPAGTEEVNTRFEKALRLCAEEHADIVIFPEMLASPASLRHCAQYVRSHWEWDMPKLILLPTCEYMGGQGWVNEWVALDADGHGLFAYHKQHPFRFERKPEKGMPSREPSCLVPIRPEFFDEPIRADRTLYLLHVPGIGRIGFLICSDVFREGYLDILLQELRVTLLLHTVYSTGTDLLERMLATAQRYLCDVVVCNTCAAWDNPLMAPEKRLPVDASGRALLNKYYPYGHKECRPLPGTTGCRQGECPSCVFVMEVADRYDGRQIPVSRRYG